jgi:pimeloyl-ACP methyl ester carboxylesterase
MLRRTLTSLALVCAFVLSACSDSTMPTFPEATDLSGTDLQAAKLAGAGSLTGEVGGAKYYIEVPENWNGDLVLYAHGYIGPDVPIEAIDPADEETGKRAQVLARGYAWAISARSDNGFAVQEGVNETNQLRGIFKSRVAAPDRIYLSSGSMGGLIMLRLLEKHPGMYAGALPICAPLDGAAEFWKSSLHTRSLFDYFYPGVLGGDALNPPAGADGGAMFGAAMGAVLANPGPAYELMNALPVPMPYASDFEMALTIGTQIFFGDPAILEEIKMRAHSSDIFDNSMTVYAGTSDDADLNAKVDRFESSPQADNFFNTWYTPSGDLPAPVLSLRTTRDQVVSPNLDKQFAARAAASGNADMLVRRQVDRFGHCDIDSATEYGPAFDDLVNWVENGVMPTP